jgi:hypothetical protein
VFRRSQGRDRSQALRRMRPADRRPTGPVVRTACPPVNLFPYAEPSRVEMPGHADRPTTGGEGLCSVRRSDRDPSAPGEGRGREMFLGPRPPRSYLGPEAHRTMRWSAENTFLGGSESKTAAERPSADLREDA